MNYIFFEKKNKGEGGGGRGLENKINYKVVRRFVQKFTYDI